MSTRGKVEEEEDGEDGDDEDYAMFDRVAADAVPVKRKQKKGLDFKRWKDIINADQADEFGNKKEQKPNGNRKPSNVKKDLNGEKLEVVKNSEYNIGVGIDDVQSNIDYGMRSTVKAKKTSFDSVPVGVGVEQGSTSIESEIDAENRARLEKMSTEEIAEAQAEIMKKMDPALIKILQKRGLDKTRNNSSTRSKTSISSNSSIISAVIGSFAESNDNKVEKVSTSDNGQNMIMADPNRKRIGLEGKDVPETKSSSGSLWDAWSTNVEAARDLRFSLDGDVINDHGSVPGNETYDIFTYVNLI